jgi:hypothetical protein
MASDNHWREKGAKLQDSLIVRKRPSEWLVLGYAIYQVLGKIRKSTESQLGDSDEESNRGENGRL